MNWLGDVLGGGGPPPRRSRGGKGRGGTVYASSALGGQRRGFHSGAQHGEQFVNEPRSLGQHRSESAPVVAEIIEEQPQPQPQPQPLLIEAGGPEKKKLKKKKKKKKVVVEKPRARNILVLGKQHAGKSAFINTYRRAITGGDGWATAPVGRAASRGTSCYEPYYDQAGDVKWVLVDTAGRRFNRGLDSGADEEKLYEKMLQGLEWKSDLVSEAGSEGSWKDSKIVPANTIDHVVFVIPATDVMRDNGVSTIPFVSTRFEPTISRVKDLASRFAWWEKHLGNAPFVVVTHMDRIGRYTWGMGETLENKVRTCLGQIVHSNRVFCITNPEDPSELSPTTESRLKSLHRKLEMDIDARMSSVLKGRNNKWVSSPQSGSSSSSSEEEEEEDIPEVNTSSLPPRASSSYVVSEPDDVGFPRFHSSPVETATQQQRRHQAGFQPGGGGYLYSMSMAQPKK